MKISYDTRTIASYYSLDKKEWHMVRLISYFRKRNIRQVIFALDELGKMAAGHFIFTISGNRFRYADQLLNIVIVLLEKIKDGVVVLAMT